MRYFQRKMIGFAAVMAFTLVYAPLRQFPFGVDAAICASFTVLIFGNAVRRRGFRLFSGDDADPAATISEITGGGAQVSIDAAGSPASAVSSVRCLRRRGRHVQVGLLLGPAATPPIPMDLVIARELEIYGSHGMAAREYPSMLALVAGQTLRPDLLLGRVIGLADAGMALAAMDQPSSTAGITVIEVASCLNSNA